MEQYQDWMIRMTPQIETSDNAFKIILPDLNAISESAKPTQTGSEKDIPEKKVIALTKERGSITRREVEMLLDMGQSSCGRLLCVKYYYISN